MLPVATTLDYMIGYAMLLIPHFRSFGLFLRMCSPIPIAGSLAEPILPPFLDRRPYFLQCLASLLFVIPAMYSKEVRFPLVEENGVTCHTDTEIQPPRQGSHGTHLLDLVDADRVWGARPKSGIYRIVDVQVRVRVHERHLLTRLVPKPREAP